MYYGLKVTLARLLFHYSPFTIVGAGSGVYNLLATEISTACFRLWEGCGLLETNPMMKGDQRLTKQLHTPVCAYILPSLSLAAQILRSSRYSCRMIVCVEWLYHIVYIWLFIHIERCPHRISKSVRRNSCVLKYLTIYFSSRCVL